MKLFAFLLTLLALPAFAQSTPDPFASIHFLEGTWAAKGTGPGGVTSTGAYTFAPDLKSNIIVRRSTASDACKGPVTFNCDHSDVLYLYPEGGALHAIYFDNEGHVLHYTVSSPTPASAIFLSDPTVPGPQFRLSYTLKAGVMTGKFEMRMPGQEQWTIYLGWSGTRK